MSFCVQELTNNSKANPAPLLCSNKHDFSRESNLKEYLEKFFSLSAREKAIREDRLYSIEVELTNRCNLECPYCYSNSSASKKQNLEPGIVSQVLKDSHSHGIRSVSWFGGEPLLHPNILDVLRSARDLGYCESILYTNGTCINANNAKALHGLVTTVAVHLDAFTPEAFGAIHHKKSSEYSSDIHDKILKCFENLFNAGFSPKDIRLSLTLCKPAFEMLEELFDWAFNKVGLQTSVFIPVAAIGRGKSLNSDWFLTKDEIRKAYELRAKYEKRPYLLELGISEYCKQYQMTMCFVRSDGDVLCYPSGEKVFGNVHENNINKIIQANINDIAFKKYSEGINNTIDSGKCHKCDNQRYCFGTRVLEASMEACFCCG